jgi:class 3 adenylate cyclase
MASSGSVLTVAFLDLSTDVRAAAAEGSDDRLAVQHRLEVIAEHVGDVDGRVIKQIGMELMCAFADPVSAVELAAVMQRNLDDLVEDHLVSRLRVGFHLGPVVEEDGDVFGDTVNIAARMTAIARPGQIICTAEVVDALSEEMRESARLFDQVQVKGSSRERAIYRILWEPRAETAGQDVLHAPPTEGVASLHLRYEDSEASLGSGDEVRLGRDARCEFVVHSEMASRFHAIISHRRGKFVLRDQSTNGTWVSMQGSPVVMLQREEIPLFGEGVISLGETVRDDGMHLIRFACG